MKKGQKLKVKNKKLKITCLNSVRLFPKSLLFYKKLIITGICIVQAQASNFSNTKASSYLSSG